MDEHADHSAQTADEDTDEIQALGRACMEQTNRLSLAEHVDANGITWRADGMWHGPRPDWSGYDLWYSGTPEDGGFGNG